jgi:hypothetical protein
MPVWDCPRCSAAARTPDSDPRAPMHDCRGLALMAIPMVRVGEHVDVRLVEREDYVGTEDVRTDAEGQPWMRSEVEHKDGHVDVWVYAPTAHAGAGAS